MADPKGFLKVKRESMRYREVSERLGDFNPVFVLRPEDTSREQASRCMDCATPFCHWGCPLASYIPEWNDLIHRGQWRMAFEFLEAANSMPEITARVCPAPCEYACVLGINDDPVTIRENELAIVEYAFREGLIRPKPPKRRTAKRIAVVGSGPAGLSAASQLNRLGHRVVVFEQDDKFGGILRYGIPDFKLEKWVLDRRIDIWRKEGVEFKAGVCVGLDYPVTKILKDFDALCLCGGARAARDLKIEGRNLKGIYFAMDYLTQANRRVAGEKIPAPKLIDARNKKVVVIGAGDTGADCLGTAHRQGAKNVVQLELLPQPPQCRSQDFPWPVYPLLLKTSSSHEEGGRRLWSVKTKRFIGEKGQVKKLSCVKVEFPDKKSISAMKEIPHSEFEIEADLVILALGFLHPEHSRLLKELGLELDDCGNVKTNQDYMTSCKGVFSAGDMRRGQSWVVWAILEGRDASSAIHNYLI